VPLQPDINDTVSHLFRQESGKMVAVLSKLLGFQNLYVAEDIVQDTLLQAMNTWGYNGLPDNPSAWLMKVAKNKAIDYIRRAKRYSEISPQYAYLLQAEHTLEPTISNLFLENEIADSQLRVVFAIPLSRLNLRLH
jgi:RNA polymerase sigma-70 factor (ECF subfamily)